MEPEMNENWTQPYENQTQPGTYPRRKRFLSSFFQKPCLQQTWLNVKVATWVKCFIVIIVLSVAAALIAPKFSSAQSQQQDSADYYDEFEDDWYYED